MAPDVPPRCQRRDLRSLSVNEHLVSMLSAEPCSSRRSSCLAVLASTRKSKLETGARSVPVLRSEFTMRVPMALAVPQGWYASVEWGHAHNAGACPFLVALQMELKDFELRKSRGLLATTAKSEQRRIGMQTVSGARGPGCDGQQSSSVFRVCLLRTRGHRCRDGGSACPSRFRIPFLRMVR